MFEKLDFVKFAYAIQINGNMYHYLKMGKMPSIKKLELWFMDRGAGFVIVKYEDKATSAIQEHCIPMANIPEFTFEEPILNRAVFMDSAAMTPKKGPKPGPRNSATDSI